MPRTGCARSLCRTGMARLNLGHHRNSLSNDRRNSKCEMAERKGLVFAAGWRRSGRFAPGKPTPGSANPESYESARGRNPAASRLPAGRNQGVAAAISQGPAYWFSGVVQAPVNFDGVLIWVTGTERGARLWPSLAVARHLALRNTKRVPAITRCGWSSTQPRSFTRLRHYLNFCQSPGLKEHGCA